MRAFLSKLRKSNIQLILKDGDLSIRHPKGEVDQQLLAAIRANKADLISYLTREKKSTIPVAAQQADYPLSSSQKRLWVLSQFPESNIAYNMPGLCIFDGELNIPLLNLAFQQLLQRHESLRTIFVQNTQGETRQVILPPDQLQFQITVLDLRENQQALDNHVQQDFLIPFDLSKAPLLRASLYQVKDQQWIFTYVMHHITSDGWSMEILVHELLTLYNNKADLLAPLRIQYKDYAVWQQQQLSGNTLQSHKDYWLSQLSGELPILQLPTDNPRPAIKTFHGANIKRKLSPQFAEGLKNICRQQDSTLFMGLLALTATLLNRYSGQEDLIIGFPIAARDHADLEHQIGFYLNTLALRLQPNEQADFYTFLQQTRQVTLGAYEHQAYPLDQLMDDLQQQRDLSRSPLFDVLIDYHDNTGKTSVEDQLPAGLSISTPQLPPVTISKFDLTFMFIENEEGLSLLLEYNTDLFEAATIERAFTHLEKLLEAIVGNPGTAINQLDYIDEKETSLLVDEFNNIPALYEGYISVIDLFKQQPGNNIAVNNLSYAELDALSDKLAIYLKKEYALKQDDLVGIMMERSEKVIIAILAILKAGAAYVPIDPAYPAARKEYIATDAQLKALITQTDFIFDIDYFNGPVFAIDAQLDTITAVNINTLHLSPIPADALAYVIYTSGSTGLPKGCAITAGNLSHYIQWADKYYFDNQPANFGLFTSISFDLSVTAIFCPLTTGGKINTYDQITEQAFLENDVLKITPSHISLLPSQSKVQTFILGGEQVNAEHIRALKSLNPNVKIFNEYGPTETTVGCIVKDISNSNTIANAYSDPDADENIKNRNTILIGKPISNTQIYLLDNHLRHVPIGIPGEIFIAGAGLAKHYLNNPALTNEKFISLNGKRLYKTGDIAKWLPTGDIQYIGRKDEQVKINGYRIELGEIENSLLNHPEISAAVVTVTKQQQLAAYYVRQINETNSVSGTTSVNEITLDLKSYLHQQLPAYMVPLFFIQLDKLPLTENGKINKQQLPDPIQNIEYVAPSNNTEQTFVNIWQDILGKEKIGLTDNFFQLGGDSIKVLRMLAAVRKELNLDISISDVYKFNTINELLSNSALSGHNQTAAAEKEQQKEKELALKNIILAEFDTLKANMPAHIEDIYPMSDIEKGMLFESIIHQDTGMYHDQMVHQRIFPNFDEQTFEEALQRISDKHEILRTSFLLDQEVQLVHKKITATLHYEDLSLIPRPVQEVEIRTFLAREMKRPFDITKAPLWRMAAFNLGKDEIIFVFQCHHAIIDGWSDALLMTELNNLYLKLLKNPAYKPEKLKVSYKDFILRHEMDKRDETIRQFWRTELATYNRLQLFTPKPSLQLKRYHLDQAQLKQLDLFAAHHQTSVKAISLSAYLYALSIISAEQDVLTGLVSNMRPNIEGSDQLLGCFLNTIPFKLAFNKDLTGQQLLSTVQNKLVALKAYERLSMAEIANTQSQPSVGTNPFFDVLFDFVDFHAYNHIEDATELNHTDFPALNVEGGVDLTNTFLDFMVNRTRGQYVVTIRITRELKSGLNTDKIAEIYFSVLKHILNNPASPITQANYISAAEQELLSHTFNNTPALYTGYTSVIDLFKKQPANNIAVNNLSYAELDALSDKLAVYLKTEYALKQDDLVGIMMERSEKVIIAILAILKAGAAYVPIDPAYPAARKEYMATDAQIKALITQTDFIFDIDYFNGPVFAIDAQLDTIPTLNTFNLPQIPADALAYVIYTSGSTGLPKGCAITAGNLSHYIQWADKYYFDNRPANFGLFTSISFDLSVTAIFCPLTTGGKINIYEEITIQAFTENESLKITPSHINLIKELGITSTDVNRFILGGEQVNEEHIKILKSLNPNVKIFNEYGPTETTVGCIVKDITDANESKNRNENKSKQHDNHLNNNDKSKIKDNDKNNDKINDNNNDKNNDKSNDKIKNNNKENNNNNPTNAILIGKPISYTEIYILNPYLQHVPIGVPGELFIAGPGLAKHYLNNQSLTDQKFISHEGKRLYKTGDIARWLPTGDIQYIGRKDEQVKIRGYRIEPGEVENCLLTHPEITAAVITVTPKQELAAYYVSDSNPDVKSYLQQHLPAYMIPLHFTQLDNLPLTPNGKVDKKQLPDPVQDFEYIAPITQTEQDLAQIWQDILGIEKAGLNDNFFDRGGHSLMAIRLVAQLQKKFNIKVDLKEIFNHGRLSEQAKLIEQSAISIYTAIPAVARKADYPLSSAQHRLWVLSQFKESNVAYNMPGVCQLEGTLDIDKLNKAFSLLIARHESLRTIFKEVEPGHPRQIILAPAAVNFQLTIKTVTESEADQLIEQQFSLPFDLGKGPLLRAGLYQLADSKWILTYVMHHIISDGWSMEILIKEVFECYNALLTGRQPVLAPLSIQYKDYASWQQNTVHTADQVYWQQQLAGELPVLQLPTDHIRPALKSFNGHRIIRRIDSNLAASLNHLCKSQHATLFMGLLSTITALLHRYSGQHDLIMGSPIAGRDHADLQHQIGFYLNTLALRLQLKEAMTFTELLALSKEVTLGAYDHQLYPFDQLVDQLELKRDLSRSPLFDVLIDYNNTTSFAEDQQLQGLQISAYNRVAPAISKYDLTFMFMESASGLSLLLEYNTDLFEAATIERMFGHIESLIEAIVEQPTSSIDELNFISQQETNLLINEFNNTPSLYEGYKSVIDLFKQQPGDNIAVNNLSYAELDALSDKLAVYLKKEYALKQDDLVGIMMERSEKVIIAMLAILKAGAAYVPIDPAYPAARKEYITTDAQLKALITQTDFIFDIDYFNGPVFAIDAQLDTIPAVNINTLYLSPIPADALAYVIYTSGSTGLPKGCAITAGNLSHYIQWADKYYFDNQPANFGLFTSISFDLSVTAVFCPLTTGGKINTYDQITEQAFLENDVLKITPSHISLLPSQSKVQTFILGGEQVNAEHIRALKSLNPNVKIFNEYGPTETTVGCIVKDISNLNRNANTNTNANPDTDTNANTNTNTDIDADENIKNINTILIGKPISNTQIYLLDNHLHHVPIGIPGEIFIAGAGLAKHYLNNPTLTNEKFISLNGKRLYKTGDIAKWLPTGEIQYIGRKDEQVKINGYRIELGEIENILLNHPEISAAVVIVTKQQQLAAYYVRQINETTNVRETPNVGESTSVNETTLDLKSYLHQQLPTYMVPLFFIQLDKLPLTENGKINKQQLPDPIQNIEYVAPSNNTEQTLVNIWQDILGKEKISLTDSFFHLGGDSIKVLRMLAAVRKELNLDIAIGDVYKFNTIRELLSNIEFAEQSQTAGTATSEKQKQKHLELTNLLLAEFDTLKTNLPPDVEDIYPMSDIEKGMIFESIIHQDQGMYHDQMVHQRTFPDFDKLRFEHALHLLSNKHEILRTSFNLNDYEKEVQLVHKNFRPSLHYKDLASLPRKEQEAHIKSFLSGEMQRPFNIQQPGLWRIAAFKLGNDELVFVFQCHHAIIDGWSDALLMTELNNLYLQLAADPDFIPQKLKSSYKDFIIHHEINKRDTNLQQFWTEELKGTQRLDLFTNEPAFQLNHYQLTPSLVQALDEAATKLNVTTKAISFSAYLYLLSILNYDQEIVTGIVSNMRPNLEDSDQLLGCFLNTIPFKMDVSEGITGQALIKQVQEKINFLKDKETLSLLDIANLHNKNTKDTNPIFDVLFDYVDFHIFSDIKEDTPGTKMPSLQVTGGVDLTNTFLDCMINRTGGNFILTLRLTRKLKSGFHIDQLANILFKIIEHLIYHPSQTLTQDVYMDKAEQELLLHSFNDIPALYNGYTSVIDLFKRQVHRTPAATALLFEGNALTYQQVHEISDRLAIYLKQEYRLQHDELVGIMLERSDKMIIAILAILKAGAAYVPVDPSYPAARKQYIIQDAQLKLLITQTDYIFDLDYFNGPVFAIDAQLDTLPATGTLDTLPATGTLDTLPTTGTLDTLPTTGTLDSLPTTGTLDTLSTTGTLQPINTPENLAYVIYTSGSTGQPKGVAITAGNLSHYIQWASQYYFNNQPTHFGLFTSISFDLSITSIFCPLITGGSLTIFNQQADMADILQQTFSPTTVINAIKLTPSHVNLLLQLELSETNISTAILGGEQVSTHHVRALKLINPSIAVYNEYGPTETTVGCIVKELDPESPVLIGKPISNTNIFILRAGNQLSPIGITGEILIGGAGLAKHYINNASLTAQKFITLNGQRLYRTGDLGRWLPDGEIQYLGRKDEQLKIRGYRIEPGEIEHVLQSHPEISTAVVTVFETQQGEKELVAYFVSEQTPDVTLLKTYLSSHLPAYMVPVYYLQLAAIPVNTNGKVDKRALPAPDTGLHTGTPYVAPANETETLLVAIWEEILGVANIGTQHNFFEVGGHSLAAIRIMARIRNEFKVELKIETLFNNATITGIAQEIARKQWATLSNSIADTNEKSTLTI